jgi:glycosyltransferase involved in cell wall biosynthesis
VPVKRVDLFIGTIALLNQQGLTCRGVIIGSGPLETKLRQLAEESGVLDQLDFKGFVNPSLDELRKLDVLLMTSDHEGLPMTLLEALALEIPVVAHEVGGIPEVLDNGSCGWLVRDHSERGYATAIFNLFQPEISTEQKLKSGWAHVYRNFGATANISAYTSVYYQIMRN